jgi:hypothetical protein
MSWNGILVGENMLARMIFQMFGEIITKRTIEKYHKRWGQVIDNIEARGILL